MRVQTILHTLTATALIFALLTLIGCTSVGNQMSQSKMWDFALSYTKAWNSQDPASVAAHYAENGSLQINKNDPSIGRHELEATAKNFMTELPDMVLTMNELSFDGVRFFYHWTLDGTNTGPGGNGNTVHISGYEEWTMSPDGLVLRSQGNMDLDEYARQLSGEPP